MTGGFLRLLAGAGSPQGAYSHLPAAVERGLRERGT